MVWAFDPLNLLSAEAAQNKKDILRLCGRDSELWVVSALAPEDLFLPSLDKAGWGRKFETLVEEIVSPRLQALQDKRTHRKILSTSSRKKSWFELLKWVRGLKAQLIVTELHPAKAPVEAQRSQHFTERLIEASGVPVLAFRSQSPWSTNRILFSTDFSKRSWQGFEKLLPLAKSWGAEIVVYHNIFNPVQTVAEVTGVSLEQSEVLFDFSLELKSKVEKNRLSFLKRAAEEKVPCQFELTHENDELTPLIQKAAEKLEANIVAMAVESHPLLRAWLPNTVRSLLAASKKPLLFL